LAATPIKFETPDYCMINKPQSGQAYHQAGQANPQTNQARTGKEN
jgi:hypothetical protein